MPARTSGKVVEIKTDLVEGLNKYKNWKKRPEVDLTSLVNNILWETLTKEMMMRFDPIENKMETLWIKDQSVFVRDKRDGLIYEVIGKAYGLYCLGHKAATCEHTTYVRTIPEMGKIYSSYKLDVTEGNWNPLSETKSK